MTVSLILGHPAPGSFNHAICAAAAAQIGVASQEGESTTSAVEGWRRP
jgi:NAD(P)H-dependent FMN reductase